MREYPIYARNAVQLRIGCGESSVTNAAGVVTRYKRATALPTDAVAAKHTRHSRIHPCRGYRAYA